MLHLAHGIVLSLYYVLDIILQDVVAWINNQTTYQNCPALLLPASFLGFLPSHFLFFVRGTYRNAGVSRVALYYLAMEIGALPAAAPFSDIVFDSLTKVTSEDMASSLEATGVDFFDESRRGMLFKCV